MTGAEDLLRAAGRGRMPAEFVEHGELDKAHPAAGHTTGSVWSAVAVTDGVERLQRVDCCLSSMWGDGRLGSL